MMFTPRPLRSKLLNNSSSRDMPLYANGVTFHLYSYVFDALTRLCLVVRALLFDCPAISSEEVSSISIKYHRFALLEAVNLSLWLRLAGRGPNGAPRLTLVVGRGRGGLRNHGRSSRIFRHTKRILCSMELVSVAP